MENAKCNRPATLWENFEESQQTPTDAILSKNFLTDDTKNYVSSYRFNFWNNAKGKLNLVWDKNLDFDSCISKDPLERVKPCKLSASYASETFRFSFDEKNIQLMLNDLGSIEYARGRFVTKPFVMFNSKRATKAPYQDLWNYTFCHGLETHAK
jgi:hypothetical protein